MRARSQTWQMRRKVLGNEKEEEGESNEEESHRSSTLVLRFDATHFRRMLIGALNHKAHKLPKFVFESGHHLLVKALAK